MDSLVIDPFEFCRVKDTLASETPLSELPRLAKEACSSEGMIKWSLIGEIDALGHPRLVLSVASTVQLRCQRCLTSFAFDIASNSALVIAKDEALADHIEEMLNDDDIDVIVVSRQLNVLELVEDEALLAIPSSPRHAACSGDALAEVPVKSDKGPSPFEALKDWKR